MSQTVLMILGALGLAVAIPAFAAKWGTRSVLLGLCLCAYLYPQTQLPAPVDPRIIGLVTIILLFFHHPKNNGETVRKAAPGALGAAVAYLLLSSLWNTGDASSAAAQGLFLLGLLFLLTVPFTGSEVRTAVISVVAYIVIATVITFVTAPSELFLAGRLRGPMINPNGLAVLAVLVYPALCGKRLYSILPTSTILLLITWETGSRAAVLAIIIQIFLILVGRMHPAGRVASVAVLVIAASYLLPSIMRTAANEGAGSESVLRSNNSRDVVWTASMERVGEHPWIGSGLGSLTSNFETGSSLFSILIVGGIIGLIFLMLAFGKSTYLAIRVLGPADWRTATLIGALASSAFEGWLIAAGTMYSLLTWLIANQIRQERPGALESKSSRTKDLQTQKSQ